MLIIMFNYPLRQAWVVGMIDSAQILGGTVVVIVIPSEMCPQILFVALISTRRNSLLHLRFELSFSNWRMKTLLIV